MRTDYQIDALKARDIARELFGPMARVGIGKTLQDRFKVGRIVYDKDLGFELVCEGFGESWEEALIMAGADLNLPTQKQLPQWEETLPEDDSLETV